MRLFSRPTHKIPDGMNLRPRTPAEAASITTRRIEITVEREWSQVVARPQAADTHIPPSRPDKELP
jgi:hypothetical protein